MPTSVFIIYQLCTWMNCCIRGLNVCFKIWYLTISQDQIRQAFSIVSQIFVSPVHVNVLSSKVKSSIIVLEISIVFT